VDNTVRLLARVAGSLQQQVEEPPEEPPSAPTVQVGDAEAQLSSGDRHYLMTPVADEEGWTAEDCIRELLGSGWYVFGERTPGGGYSSPATGFAFTGVLLVSLRMLRWRQNRSARSSPTSTQSDSHGHLRSGMSGITSMPQSS